MRVGPLSVAYRTDMTAAIRHFHGSLQDNQRRQAGLIGGETVVVHVVEVGTAATAMSFVPDRFGEFSVRDLPTLGSD